MYLLIIWLSFNHLITEWLPKMQLGIDLAILLSVGKMEDEVKPKKLPRLRKPNFSPLDEPMRHREIENTLMWWRKDIIMMWPMWRKLEFAQN